MDAHLSRYRRVLHDLGLAASVGGGLYGRTGLHAGARSVSSPIERRDAVSQAWKRFTPINLASHLAVAVTWWLDRSLARRRPFVFARKRALASALPTGRLLGDVLAATYLGAGLASIGTGYAASRTNLVEDAEELDVENAPTHPRALFAEAREHRLLAASRSLGWINLAAGALLISLGSSPSFGARRTR